MTSRVQTVALALFASLAVFDAACADVVRHPIPNSNFPIAQAVEVSGNVTTYYISGQVPPVVNKDADPATQAAYGDTKTQTVGALNRIKAILEGLGLTIGDVVKMQVFLVHSAAAPMDFKAFMEGFSSAAACRICRRARWLALQRSPIPASWSRSR